jgi:hypothetical protein
MATHVEAHGPWSPAVLGCLALLLCGAPARAQEAPPIGPFVIDVHGTIPLFPTDLQQLADAHGVSLAELPGPGLGVDLGAHVYFARWRAITFGVGGRAIVARSEQQLDSGDPAAAPVKARFISGAGQLSFNFGTGRGWSYLSGGVGLSTWSIHREGTAPGSADEERLGTFNYGGGARWFAKEHLAFSLDLRFYAVGPGTPVPPRPGSPRTTLFVIGAGVSLK